METVAIQQSLDRMIVEDLIGTPVVKEVLMRMLRSIESDRGRVLMEKVMWNDPEVMLSLIGSLPHMINYTMNMLAGFGEEIREKFSPQLLTEFLGSIIKDVDTARIRDCAVIYAALATDLWHASPELQGKIKNVLRDFAESNPEFMVKAHEMAVKQAPKMIGGGITAAACWINSIDEKDPQAVSRFVQDIFRNVDADEFKKATHVIVHAFLDQKPGFISWAWRLIISRFKGRKV
ncbi:MAG: hypothetical protein ABSB79_10055 [Syntrophales bacterium]|jgi:hypothetical protein